MLNFALGAILGVLLSILAIIVGKKATNAINHPTQTVQPLVNSFKEQKAIIIKKEDPIEDFLNNQ